MARRDCGLYLIRTGLVPAQRRFQQPTTLVDLDTVMPTAWFWDVGDLLRSASSYGAEDDPVATHNAVVPDLHNAIMGSLRQ